MVELHSRDEATPAAWPLTPSRYPHLAQIAPMLWARIEAYTAFRFSPRSVTWIVEGSGDWRPTLSPAAVTAVELWQDGAWSAVTLDPSPVGGYVLAGSTYRFTATVGEGFDVQIPDPDPDALPDATVTAYRAPAVVEEAFGRLGEYLQESVDTARAVPATEVKMGDLQFSWPEWKPGRAMQLSGAADLLRQYRRA